MKNQFLKSISVLVLTALLISCSSDNTSEDNNPLYGTWLYNRTLDYVNGEVSYIFIPEECSLNDSFTFLSNGTYTHSDFGQDNNNNCTKILENDEVGTWKHIGNDVYEFIETTNGINEPWGPATIIFTDDNIIQMIYPQDNGSSHNEEFRRKI